MLHSQFDNTRYNAWMHFKILTGSLKLLQTQKSVRLHERFFCLCVYYSHIFGAFFNPELPEAVTHVAQFYWLLKLRHGKTGSPIGCHPPSTFSFAPSRNVTVV